MKREQLEHIIRAASAVTNVSDIVVIGSQALLAYHPDAAPTLLVSVVADIFPRGRPELSAQIDAAIGELSLFHETFGYCAHGVDEHTAVLPVGWEERLVPLCSERTGGATGWRVEVHDLAVSKLAAAREKDLRFVSQLAALGGVRTSVLRDRIATPPEPQRSRIQQKLDSLVARFS